MYMYSSPVCLLVSRPNKQEANFASGVAKTIEELKTEIASVKETATSKIGSVNKCVDKYLEALKTTKKKCSLPVMQN
jgi:hypothetical protein